MKEREVLKLALEALKGYRRELNDGQPCDAEQAIEKLLAQPEQEPVACLICKEWEAICDQHLRHIKKLKKQRIWVGLTDEEVNELVEQTECEDYYGLVEATEAKLKEKNT